MIIAVTAKGQTLESEVDPTFGRCGYFLFVDTETMNTEAVGNESAGAPGGAGIQAAQTVASHKAEAVITGNVGPNAMEALSAAGIRVMTGFKGTVRGAVEAFNAGRLVEAKGPSVGSHHGMGARGGRQ